MEMDAWIYLAIYNKVYNICSTTTSTVDIPLDSNSSNTGLYPWGLLISLEVFGRYLRMLDKCPKMAKREI